MKNRREFLKTSCPSIAFAILGVSLIQACSTSDETLPDPDNQNNNIGGGSANDNSGITINGTNVTVDLSNSNFVGMSAVGGWKNLTNAGVLLLRVGTDTIRAFDNCCPHQGTKSQWTYSSNTFKCNNHGNSFGIGTNEKLCSSGATSGDLKEFATNISANTLTINMA